MISIELAGVRSSESKRSLIADPVTATLGSAVGSDPADSPGKTTASPVAVTTHPALNQLDRPVFFNLI
ncbi:MAG TPA: hypothetical protein PLN31_10820 [Azoarcus taiwanensis]|nr:hypothetical protein [Azoarcus taiwanensis]